MVAGYPNRRGLSEIGEQEKTAQSVRQRWELPYRFLCKCQTGFGIDQLRP